MVDHKIINTMPITKVVTCPKCKTIVIWDGYPKKCGRCNMELIPQGGEADGRHDFGVVLEDNTVLLMRGKKK